MKSRYLILITAAIILIGGCITQFIPETDESSDILVVEGMITDQFRTNKIKISKTLPLGKIVSPKPVKGAVVTITDGYNSQYRLMEYPTGTYYTDSTIFRGKVGGKYTLRILTGGRSYVSSPMEMKPVPKVDSLYYEKVVITERNEWGYGEEGCQIYLDTYDPSGQCLFYRWDFAETWEIRLPYNVPNWKCWITRASEVINIRNTSVYGQARVKRYPLLFVSNKTDRLKEKYSILVKQLSLTLDEFNYWEKLQNVYENVGGLYDVTPMAIPSNIRNEYNPDEIVLGYFSVSAVSEKRIFIDELFSGMPYLYNNCPADTIWGGSYVHIDGLGSYVWVIDDHTYEIGNPYRVITFSKECADCTTRGTSVKPSFWQ